MTKTPLSVQPACPVWFAGKEVIKENTFRSNSLPVIVVDDSLGRFRWL